MNREGAETYLRLLTERRLRGPLPPVRGHAWRNSPWDGLGPGGAGGTIVTVSQALTAVRALDEETTGTILADFNLAVSVRARPDPSQPAAGGARARPGRVRFARTGPMIRGGVGPYAPMGGFPAGGFPAGGFPAGATGTAPPGPAGQTGPDAAGFPDRSVRLEDAAEPVVSPLALSPGEQLLILWAERLLTAIPAVPHDPWPPTPAPTPTLPEMLHAVAAGFGEVIGALQAADVLSPLSPVPGQLAAVCANLQVSEHGITAPPARDLPEPWLGLLAHYQRRKPDSTPVADGYATVATSLPELDGIRLALLGLLNAGGCSWIQLLARGPGAKYLGGAPPGVDDHFPLSFWIRDHGGRWHAGRLDRVHQLHGEWAVTLQLVPPLARSTRSIEVLAAGRSAQVRIRLPLRWGFPP